MYVRKTTLVMFCAIVIVFSLILSSLDRPVTWDWVGLMASGLVIRLLFANDYKNTSKEKNEVIIYASALRKESINIDASTVINYAAYYTEEGWWLRIDLNTVPNCMIIRMKDTDEANHYKRVIEKAQGEP